MGADLYLNSVFQKYRDRYAPKFDHWVAKRDALHKAGQQAAADKAQKQVLRYYDKMYQRGYFRDSYNSSNLLWLFELSWWQDVLEDRESVFQANLAKVKPADGETRAEVEKYFREKYERLKAFLRQAIDRYIWGPACRILHRKWTSYESALRHFTKSAEEPENRAIC